MKLPPLLVAGVLGWFVFASATAAAAPRVRVVVPGESLGPVAELAVARLRTYAGQDAVLAPAGSTDGMGAALTIVLGTPADDPELRRQWTSHSAAVPDAYLIKTIARDPLTVAVSGNNARGTLYAAYRLADLLRARSAVSALDLFREPRIAERFVSFGATMYGRRQYVPEQHWKTVNELPGFGYNGIVIYPGGGTPIGRRSSPIVEAEDGTLRIDPENTAKWKAWFSELKKYQLDLMMTIPPAIPPGFTRQAIAAFYAGGEEPKGYLDALRTHFREYLRLLTATYPELDKFMFNSTEGATFGRNERFFGAPGNHPAADYLRNNVAVMRVYFDVIADVFGPNRDRVYFWTHSYGLTSDGVAKMREVLFTYPWVTILEDDYWNNNLWPMDLSAMAYLPRQLRAEVSTRNPFALFQIATDGEYYGGGSLPNAYPGSHIRSAREAVDRHARMVIQRLDLHDRTPWGTAFGTMKIVPYAASQQLWSPTPDEAVIWREWAEARFGPEAASAVIRALQESHTVLIDGLSGNGFDLLVVGSEFQPGGWSAERSGVSRFQLFGRPGQPILHKQPGEPILSSEYTVWQTDTHSLSIAEFRRRQQNARAAVMRGLAAIEEAQPHLSADDYTMLHGIFVNGDHVLHALRLLGETAYGANLVLDNYDHVLDPQATFRHAAAQLEAFLAENKLTPEMTKNLRTILQQYRAVTARRR